MRYLFEMGKTWHIYADMGDEWVYYRLERTQEEVLDKKAEMLPGPLGRLELFQELENQVKEEKARVQEEKKLVEAERMRTEAQKETAKKLMEEAQRQKKEFERSYEELQKLAEELQEEGKLWRQRYLDLAYQVSPKGK